jgi:hypothetical protein
MGAVLTKTPKWMRGRGWGRSYPFIVEVVGCAVRQQLLAGMVGQGMEQKTLVKKVE